MHFAWSLQNALNNKTGLQPVSKPVEQPQLGFKTLGKVFKNVKKCMLKKVPKNNH